MGSNDDTILLLGILAIGVYAYTQTDLLDFVKTGMKGGGGGGGGGGGAFSKGGTCPGGQSCTFDGKDRWECENVPHAEYEATWCGSVSGNDNLSIKMWGPNHSGSSACCWCIMNVGHQKGNFYMRGEGPHPTTKDISGATGGSMGPLQNTCVKAVITKGPKGAHVEGYGLTGGQWKKYLTYDGPCGLPGNQLTAGPAKGQQVSFRFDVSGVKTTCATVKPLSGGAPSPRPDVGPPPTKANYGGMWYPQKQSISTLYEPRYYRLLPTI